MSSSSRSLGWSRAEGAIWIATRSNHAVSRAAEALSAGSSEDAALHTAVVALALDEALAAPGTRVTASPAPDDIVGALKLLDGAVHRGEVLFGRKGRLAASRVRALWPAPVGRPRRRHPGRRKLVTLATLYRSEARGDTSWRSHEDWCRDELGMTRTDELLDVRREALPFALREIEARLRAGIIDFGQATTERSNVQSWSGKQDDKLLRGF